MRPELGIFRRRSASQSISARRWQRQRRIATLQFESLEQRSYLAGDTFTLNFDVPDDVASQGVWISVNGLLTADYKSLSSGDYVYFHDGDYAEATTTADLSFQLTVTGGVASLEIPNTPLTSGQVVIGVGSAPNTAFNGTGISSPTPTDKSYFGLFEFTLTGPATGDPTNNLDIDLSEIDQVGVPFYVTAADPAPPQPANDGFGITQPRDTLFNNYQTYLTDQRATIFSETYSQGNIDGTQYRIVAPKNLNLGNDAFAFPTTAISFSAGGTLTVNQEYYWFVTGTSATGESAPSVGVGGMTATAGQQTATFSWKPYAGATGYKIYRGTTNDPADAVLIGQVSGYGTTSFVDNGSMGNSAVPTHTVSIRNLRGPQGAAAATGSAPPTNGYTYSALNGYFNDAIDTFFDYYTDHTFTLYYAGDNMVFTGGVTTFPKDGHNYTVLEVHPLGNDSELYRIYKPFFADNMDPTKFPGLPPAPSWMPDAATSPADMILSCNGVFDSGDKSAANPGYLADLGNAISSAFNRGLASQTSMHPSSWASNPALYGVTPAAGNLPANHDYYYVITAVTGYDDGTNQYDFGESVISLERKLAASSSPQGATLTWQATDPPGTPDGPAHGITQYNVYRSTTPGKGYKLVQTITNGDNPPATSWTDTGAIAGTLPPPVFYAPGSTSNWYAAYQHLNSTNDPTNGVSINGLAYGYAYDDQGGFSTNIQWPGSTDGSGVPNSVTIHLTSWGEAPNPPNPNPNPNPHPDDSPAKIVMIEQPVTVKKGSWTTVQFKVLTASGLAYQGGSSVQVTIEGTNKGTYTVEIDETTGIGTLTFKNKRVGMNMLKLSMEGTDVVAYSDAYQVVSKHVPKKAMKAIDRAYQSISPKVLQSALRALSRIHH